MYEHTKILNKILLLLYVGKIIFNDNNIDIYFI